jgi:hypothetical protein
VSARRVRGFLVTCLWSRSQPHSARRGRSDLVVDARVGLGYGSRGHTRHRPWRHNSAAEDPPYPPESDGWPQVAALVELNEGSRLMTNIVGDAATPEELLLDARVDVELRALMAAHALAGRAVRVLVVPGWRHVSARPASRESQNITRNRQVRRTQRSAVRSDH